MNGITPIRDRMLFDFHSPSIYAAQWDGTKQQATLLIGELERICEEMGASVISAHYRAQLSRGAPDIALTIGRHEDDYSWSIDISRDHWIVLWRDHSRLADVETLHAVDGERRFRPIAPIIILSGRAPEIEGS